jgi:hypothetical protein
VTDDHVMALGDIGRLKDVSFTGTKVSDEVALTLNRARPDMRVRDVAGLEVDPKKPGATLPRRPPVENLDKVEPAFRLTAEEFHKEYEAGKNAAATKYAGKVIELAGEVAGVNRNIGGESSVTLKVEKDLLGVWCGTADEEPWTKVLPGQKIKIKGKWPEFPVRAALVHCVFVETGEYLGVRVTAEELAAEYTADRDGTAKKYDKKYLVMTGEVLSKEFNSAGAAGIVLKSGNKVKVTCSFTAFENEQTKRIKVGQRIKVVGQFTSSFTGDEVGLYFCLPVSGSGANR